MSYEKKYLKYKNKYEKMKTRIFGSGKNEENSLKLDVLPDPEPYTTRYLTRRNIRALMENPSIQNLPPELIEEIVRYLSFRDLRNFAKAYIGNAPIIRKVYKERAINFDSDHTMTPEQKEDFYEDIIHNEIEFIREFILAIPSEMYTRFFNVTIRAIVDENYKVLEMLIDLSDKTPKLFFDNEHLRVAIFNNKMNMLNIIYDRIIKQPEQMYKPIPFYTLLVLGKKPLIEIQEMEILSKPEYRDILRWIIAKTTLTAINSGRTYYMLKDILERIGDRELLNEFKIRNQQYNQYEEDDF